MKRKPSDCKCEKTFANEVTYKGLISKIHKQLMKLNIKNKQTTQSKNGQKTQIDISLFSNQTHASSAPYNQQFTVAKT